MILYRRLPFRSVLFRLGWRLLGRRRRMSVSIHRLHLVTGCFRRTSHRPRPEATMYGRGPASAIPAAQLLQCRLLEPVELNAAVALPWGRATTLLSLTSAVL